MMSVVVGLVVLFCAGAAAAWWRLPGLRALIEAPKFRVIEQEKRFGRRRGE